MLSHSLAAGSRCHLEKGSRRKGSRNQGPITASKPWPHDCRSGPRRLGPLGPCWVSTKDDERQPARQHIWGRLSRPGMLLSALSTACCDLLGLVAMSEKSRIQFLSVTSVCVVRAFHSTTSIDASAMLLVLFPEPKGEAPPISQLAKPIKLLLWHPEEEVGSGRENASHKLQLPGAGHGPAVDSCGPRVMQAPRPTRVQIGCGLGAPQP